MRDWLNIMLGKSPSCKARIAHAANEAEAALLSLKVAVGEAMSHKPALVKASTSKPVAKKATRKKRK